MIVNGEEKQLTEETTVYGYLESHGYEPAKCAVLLNGNVVPRSKTESTALKNSDVMEIVSFVGGG